MKTDCDNPQEAFTSHALAKYGSPRSQPSNVTRFGCAHCVKYGQRITSKHTRHHCLQLVQIGGIRCNCALSRAGKTSHLSWRKNPKPWGWLSHNSCNRRPTRRSPRQYHRSSELGHQKARGSTNRQQTNLRQ